MASYTQTVLSDSPNACWPLSETSGTFGDITGNGVVMTAHGSITRSVSTGFAGVGNGVSFGGTASDFIDTPANPLTRPTTALTYECWFKAASYGTNQCMMGLTAVGGTDGIGFGVVTAGQTLFGFLTNAGTTAVSATTALGTATWHHCVLAGAGTAGSPWKVYLDGSEVTSGPNTTGISGPAGTFNLGIDNGSLLPIRAGGALAFCAIYPTALSAARVSAHYAARNSAGGGGSTQTTVPPGQLVSALAHERNAARKQDQTPGKPERISDYYKLRRR